MGSGSEQNCGSLLLFLFHGTEFQVVFSSPEGFGTEFKDFLFLETTGIPSEITISSVYSAELFFCRKLPNTYIFVSDLQDKKSQNSRN
jgi:hypothetical protein